MIELNGTYVYIDGTTFKFVNEKQAEKYMLELMKARMEGIK